MKDSLPDTLNTESSPKMGTSAFALVSTLLIIAVLTIMVIAFMQSMRVDRLTARSYLDKYRADLAAQSGINYAVAQLRLAVNDTNTGKGDFAYTTELMRDTNTVAYSPVLTISRYSTNASGTSRTVFPLISGTNALSFSFTNFSNVISPTNPYIAATRKKIFDERRSTNSTDLNGNQQIQSTNTFGAGTDAANYFRVAFLPLTNSLGKVAERFAYSVFDEQAKLNPQFHRAAPRDNGAIGEIPLSLGDSTIFTTAEQAAFLADTSRPAGTSAAMRFFTTTDRATDRRQFFGSYDVVNQDVIPMSYADGGKPKYDINDLATNTVFGSSATARAENIANIIDKNIPTFKSRDLSLGGESDLVKKNYLNRLAASIVDYIDTDTDSTTVNGGEPAGRDLFPMVTAVAEQFTWIGQSYNSATREYTATFKTRAYAQIWNPYTTTMTGNVRLGLRNRMRIHYGNNLSIPFANYDPINVSVTVRPNEFKVVEFAVANQDFVDPLQPGDPVVVPAPPFWNTSPGDASDQVSHTYFQLYWNDKLVDMNSRSPLITTGVSGFSRQAGMPRSLKNFVMNTVSYQVGFIPTQSSAPNWRYVGDPRASYLSTYDWAAMADSGYPGSSCWGGIQTSTMPRYQNFTANWINRDFIRANPVTGNTPGSLNKTPAMVTSPYDNPATALLEKVKAPFYIRNGNMLSIGELGNIFDPVQADDSGAAPSGGTPPAPYVAAGGRTLRIGQPEFSFPLAPANTWDVPGKRASQLLDLFTVNKAPVTNGYPETKGRINLNTAPSEVIQALLYNIQIKSDEGVGTSMMDTAKSKILADAIVADRNTNGHYLRLSDLYRIYGLVDGSSAPYWNKASAYQPNLGAGSAGNPPEVMDRAREELFTKMVNLVDTQSRAFRIYAIGQALSPTGKVAARSGMQALVVVEQGTDSAGNIVLIPRIVYEGSY